MGPERGSAEQPLPPRGFTSRSQGGVGLLQHSQAWGAAGAALAAWGFPPSHTHPASLRGEAASSGTKPGNSSPPLHP